MKVGQIIAKRSIHTAAFSQYLHSKKLDNSVSMLRDSQADFNKPLFGYAMHFSYSKHKYERGC